MPYLGSGLLLSPVTTTNMYLGGEIVTGVKRRLKDYFKNAF